VVEKAKMMERLFQLVQPAAEGMGYDLADFEFVKEGSNWYLRLYIDKESGVDLDDCETVSRAVSAVLDREDLIPMAYFLEVSSPGLERVLRRDKDFARFQGSLVNVRLFAPWEGKKLYQGLLGKVAGQQLELKVNGRDMVLPRDQIALIRLAWEGLGGK
jgi:ribosome maturation factor RimP